jgi:hypothetical protein
MQGHLFLDWHVWCQLGTLRVNLQEQQVFSLDRGCFHRIGDSLTRFSGSPWRRTNHSLCLARYNFSVARGWESKSVEEQQAQAVSPSGPAPPPLTPAQIASQRQRTGLLLSRQRVLQQLEAAQNPRHRQILQSALADLDAHLARLV